MSLSSCSPLLLFIQLAASSTEACCIRSLSPLQVQSCVGILEKSIPLFHLVCLSGHFCHLKAAKYRASGGSEVIQGVEREGPKPVLRSGNHRPTMKAENSDDRTPARVVCLSPHHLFWLLSSTLLGDCSSSVLIPLWLAVGGKGDLSEHGTVFLLKCCPLNSYSGR